MFLKNNQLDIVVNGKRIQCTGRNISIQNNEILVDGRPIQSDVSGDIHVIVYGNINKLSCSGSVEVHGSCGSVDCSGSCTVKGDVNGDIDAVGGVTCGNVTGNIDAVGGVRCRR